MTSDPKRMICEHFVQRIYGDKAAAMTQRYLPDQSNIRSICKKCMNARGIVLPKAYADLGGLARCSCCGEVADCRDPDVLARYARSGIDPHAVYLRMPTLRHPLNGDHIHISVIDALIRAAMGGSTDG